MNMNLEHYKQGLQQTEVTLEPGLSQNEIQAIEKNITFDFRLTYVSSSRSCCQRGILGSTGGKITKKK